MGDDDSSGSPRIGVSRRGSSSSFSALFRQLSQVVSAKRRGTAAAAPPAAAALEPPPPAHSYRELAALEQCGGASAAQGSPTLPELPHASPAHLLAPAPATLGGASPPAAVVQLVAAGGDADGEGGSGAGAEQQLDDLLMDLLDELPAAPAAPTAQLAAAVAAEAAEALPAAQQLEADDEEQELQALLAQQVSDLSSPTSGHYSPAAAQGRNLRGPTPSASGTTGSWQAQREEGVQRSLAHPIFALQPGELPPQAAASLDALVAAQRRPRQEGSPQCCISSAVRCHEGAATPGPAWRLEDGHFALDLELDELAPAPGGDSPACPASPLSMLSLALEGVPDAPAAAAAWAGTPASQLQQEQQQHEHVAVSCMAGHYDAIAQRFARLDLRRLRCVPAVPVLGCL